MLKLIKILALPLLLAVILAALSLAGCGGNAAEPEGPGGEMTGEQAKQMVADSVLAVSDVNTYTFAMDMEVAAEAVGGSSPGTMSINMGMDGAADLAAKKMHMSLELSLEALDIEGVSGDMMQNISADLYMMVDKIYMKMNVPELGDQWVQLPLTEEIEEAYNLDMIEKQLEPIRSALEVKYLKTEKVDGSDCYVFKIVPDVAAMLDWVESQQMATGGLNFGAMESLEDIFNELSYTAWIDKNSKMMRQMNVDMVMEMNAEEFGASDTEFDTITMEISMKMNLRDFNEPVSIVLPEEAEDAEMAQ